MRLDKRNVQKKYGKRSKYNHDSYSRLEEEFYNGANRTKGFIKTPKKKQKPRK